MTKYKGLQDYLKYITKTHGLQLCINDLSGFLYTDQELLNTLEPYIIHSNPFCMKIKSDKKLWDRCLLMKPKLYKKCKETKGAFFGMCFCGVEEYIVPIIYKDDVIGLVCAGQFSKHKEEAQNRIKKIAQEYHMDEEELNLYYLQSVNDKCPDEHFISSILGIVADYISNIYGTLAPSDTKLTGNMESMSSINNILMHALEFIHKNYSSPINLGEVAKICHCSESYLSRIFKGKMKINIKLYINKIRVEHSKDYLLKTDFSITEIAQKVGFNDSNYFSSVFHSICSMTPTDFKKQLLSRRLG